MPARSKPRVYLSGGMEYAKGEGSDWRREIEAWLGKTILQSAFNPNTQSARFLAKRGYTKGSFRALKTRDPEQYQRLVSLIVDRDSQEIIKNTSYVICKWDRGAERGAGSKGEMTIARLIRKPVYIVTRISNSRIPGWVLGCATQVFPSFSALKSFLEKKYGGQVKEGS